MVLGTPFLFTYLREKKSGTGNKYVIYILAPLWLLSILLFLGVPLPSLHAPACAICLPTRHATFQAARTDRLYWLGTLLIRFADLCPQFEKHFFYWRLCFLV